MIIISIQQTTKWKRNFDSNLEDIRNNCFDDNEEQSTAKESFIILYVTKSRKEIAKKTSITQLEENIAYVFPRARLITIAPL